MRLLCGLETSSIPNEDLENLKKKWPTFFNAQLSKVEGIDGVIPQLYIDKENYFYNLKTRPTDVFVAGYARSGTTFTQEIIWTLLHNPNVEKSDIASAPIYVRVPYFEIDGYFELEEQAALAKQVARDDTLELKNSFVEALRLIRSPRIMKTHLQASLLNPRILKTSKIVCVMRNPMDVFLSNYLFLSAFDGYQFQDTIEEFYNFFEKGQTVTGSLRFHMMEWWKYRTLPNVHLVFYEDLCRNTKEEISKIADFLEVSVSENQIEKIFRHVQIDEMKKNLRGNTDRDKFDSHFENSEEKGDTIIRKGKIGESKERIPLKLQEKLKNHFKKLQHIYDLEN